jgi:hypothetical protein
MDLLVDSGVLEDDDYRIVPALHLIFGAVDPKMPRAEIDITEASSKPSATENP